MVHLDARKPTERARFRLPAPARYNVAPDPPGVFAALTAITKLTGPFGERCATRSRSVTGGGAIVGCSTEAGAGVKLSEICGN